MLIRIPTLASFLSLLAAGLGLCAPVPQVDPPKPAPETKLTQDARMAWWREAKFGLFIHWGLYAQAAGYWNGQTAPAGSDQRGEWIMSAMKIPVADYGTQVSEFNPVKFDADQWVTLAKESGFKYIVITAKHHDGFAMFHSADPFNICDATPFKRDPMRELADACKKHGMRLGFYYSQAQDWSHPGGGVQQGSWDPAQAGSMDDYLNTIAIPQIKQLLTQYGPVAELWYDTPVAMTKERSAPVAAMVNSISPQTIINNRLGGGFQGDFATPEGFIPATGYPNRDWESCIPMAATWGYKKDVKSYIPSATLLSFLIDIASKGGNFLLNISPMATGEIPAAQVERLRDIGAWLKVNGEAIYGTKPSIFGAETGHYDQEHLDKNGNPTFQESWDWRCTTTEDHIYIHLFNWPKGPFVLNDVPNQVTQAYLLADPKHAPLAFTQKDRTVAVNLPESAPQPMASVLALKVKGPLTRPAGNALAQNADGSLNLAAECAEILNGGDAMPTLTIQGTHLGSWTRAGDYAQWTTTIKTPGKFRVFATYALDPSSGSVPFQITAGNAVLNGSLSPTGSWVKYKGCEIGSLEIAETGSVTIAIKPVQLKKAFVNLRSLLLIPEK